MSENKGLIASIVGGMSLGAAIGIILGALLGRQAVRDGWHEPDWNLLLDRISTLPLPGRSDSGVDDNDAIHA